MKPNEKRMQAVLLCPLPAAVRNVSPSGNPLDQILLRLKLTLRFVSRMKTCTCCAIWRCLLPTVVRGRSGIQKPQCRRCPKQQKGETSEAVGQADRNTVYRLSCVPEMPLLGWQNAPLPLFTHQLSIHHGEMMALQRPYRAARGSNALKTTW